MEDKELGGGRHAITPSSSILSVVLVLAKSGILMGRNGRISQNVSDRGRCVVLRDFVSIVVCWHRYVALCFW